MWRCGTYVLDKTKKGSFDGCYNKLKNNSVYVIVKSSKTKTQNLCVFLQLNLILSISFFNFITKETVY